MDSIRQWFEHNLDAVFFVYGLAFMVMGIAILTQARKGSKFKLAGILWLLALFGLTHGSNEILDMWAVIKGRGRVLDAVRWGVLVISYIFLFEFGRRIFRLTVSKSSLWLKEIAGVLGWWLSLLLLFIVLVFGFASQDFYRTGSVWSRYLLGLSGGLLTGLGFFSYYKYEREILEIIKVKKYFLCVGLSFLVYGILGGLVVPKADFFPARWLNTDSFLLVVGVPVQVFRAICAVIIAWAAVGILRIFGWETIGQVRDALAIRERVTEGIDEGIMLLDKGFKIIWANKKQRELYGEIEGDYCYHATHKRDSPCEPPHDTCPVYDVLKTGKSSIVIHTHFDRDGKETFVEVSAYPIRDESGEIVQFVHVSRDITERKRMQDELENAYIKLGNAHLQLVQSEKLAAVGRLAAGVAHEINNPLFVISGEAQMLSKTKDQETRDALKVILDQTERIKEIVGRLMEFSKPREFKREPLEINTVIEEAIPFLSHQVGVEGVKIVKKFDMGLPKILGDRHQLQEVFLNIMLNAIQSMEGGGSLTIVTYSKKVDKYGRRETDRFKLGDTIIVVEIKDTGKGMDDETLRHVFDPFFTTKEKGMGLGLSICYGIIENHAGTIEAQSSLGEGSSFVVKLPIREEARQ